MADISRIHMEAVWQICDWAKAYVENETVIPETPNEHLKHSEVAALAVMQAILAGRAQHGA